MPYSKYNNWPKESHPNKSIVYICNSIDINASTEQTWSWLVSAGMYHQWYKHWKNVRFDDKKQIAIKKVGDVFTPKIKGNSVPTTVIDFHPMKQLAWTGKDMGIRGVHSWILHETPNGCHVITEETLIGWPLYLVKKAVRYQISKWHDYWLQQLKTHAEKGAIQTIPESEMHF